MYHLSEMKREKKSASNQIIPFEHSECMSFDDMMVFVYNGKYGFVALSKPIAPSIPMQMRIKSTNWVIKMCVCGSCVNNNQ